MDIHQDPETSRYLDLESTIDGGSPTWRARDDIPFELQPKIFTGLLMAYRARFGEESPLLRQMEKAQAIGLLEQAFRTSSRILLPLAHRTTT